MNASSEKSFPFRLDFPPELPISARAEEIVAALQANQVLILAGETGSGKTTQIPKMCLAAGRGTQGRIACTQPRRVAALSVSKRVAEELNVAWGREVGAKIRFADQTSRETVIKFLTDGMLLAEVQSDPLLRAYDTIIIDEAHERSLNIDFLLGHLRTLRFKRPELKIVITSATIDTQAFSEAFDGAPIIEVSGRTYPVEVIYAPLDAFGTDFTEETDVVETNNERAAHQAEALHYVEGAVESVRRIVDESTAGDVLVFMPSERDIRETCEALEGLLPRSPDRQSELVPLFGRLTNAEQQRVFAPAAKRKIIVATNIAETSLTIPGIRFVVDTGLARISRYSPQARTRRLPIEPVAQSSADQRKGRAGRVAEGVCVRLYAEEDFLARPRFMQPEIQRANLADVILRLKAFGLGDIERFPFINPPVPKAIRSGYALLVELGALAEEAEEGGRVREDTRPHLGGEGVRALTAIGRDLARLPVDPTVGRMILQARAEKCLREVLVIAAGLSIQDPRERPLDKQAAADTAHRRFQHADSDFLTLLNIWEAYHGEVETMTQSRLRRFCREHFLSYTRMREWRDVHAQLVDVLRERRDWRMTSVFDAMREKAAGNTGGAESGSAGPKEREQARGLPRREGGETRRKAARPAGDEEQDPLAWGTPAYRAIHRSVLAGLLGNIAVYDEDSRLYKATHDRRVALFPGSVLFKREEKRPSKTPAGGGASGKRMPRWIMAAEVVETSRLYARTCARLDPVWAMELGAHLVKTSHSEPFWNEEKGRVMVKQRTRLYGLELDVRGVSYGRLNPREATEIFIREGLVNDTITWPFDFLAHNRALREQVETSLTRTRDSSYLNLDEAFYRFYAERLMPKAEADVPRPAGAKVERCAMERAAPPEERGISSVAELVDFVRERQTDDPRFLRMELADLRDPETLRHDAAEFPEALPLQNRVLPLAYTYKPGQPDDGVTLDVAVRDAAALTPAALDWAVPGHLAPKVEHYLGVLPKEVRRVLIPFAETVRSVTEQVAQRDRLTDRRETLPQALAEVLSERFSVRVAPGFWADKPPPEHLRVRMRVRDDKGRELGASRELDEIRAVLATQAQVVSARMDQHEPDAWRRARVRWEKTPQTAWTFGDVPARVPVADQAGVPVHAFPGLHTEAEGVALRLFRSENEARDATRTGVARLLEYALSRDLGWLERDLRRLRELGALPATFAPLEQLQADAFQGLRQWLCEPARGWREFAENTNARGAARPEVGPYRAEEFSAAVVQAKADLRGALPRLLEWLREILTVRQELLVHPQPYAGMAAELAELVPADFLRTTPFGRVEHLPRYLNAMRLRAERWRKNPAKDAERAREIAPLAAEAAKRGRDDPARWLVEELRVSLFAQELGTVEPVSVVKVQRALQNGVKARSNETPPRKTAAPAPTPRVVAPDAGKKAPLKSFGSLGQLFPRG